jgi:CRISPR-associated protein Csm3
MKKVKHFVITGTIELKSGTRIGGSDDVLQIGGTDLSCIKDPVTGKPYIPGTSLKGRMRSELERDCGRYGRNPDEPSRTNTNDPCGCAKPTCPICRVFGPHKNTNHQLGPSRVLVRDAPLLEGGQFEHKTEAIIQRQSNTALNPRTVERVAPGSKFALEIGLQFFDLDEGFEYEDPDGKTVRGAEALQEVIVHALDLIEQTGIGSGTSKGYGAVEIQNLRIVEIGRRRRAAQLTGPAE